MDQGSKLMEKREKLQDYDLWAVSKSLRHSLPIEAKNTWVKAHQDDGDTPLAELPPAGTQINIAVDALAGGLQNSIQGTGPLPVPHYGPEQKSIFLRGRKIIHDIRTTIENHYNGKRM